jgi:hypothetical protein
VSEEKLSNKLKEVLGNGVNLFADRARPPLSAPKSP